MPGGNVFISERSASVYDEKKTKISSVTHLNYFVCFIQ